MSKTFKKVKNEFVSNSKKNIKPIYLWDRDTKVAELAYYKAENRGFLPGNELKDWLEAEQEFSF